MSGMKRLLIVSNRLPVSVVKRGGHLHYQSSAGGLATALSSMTQYKQKYWIGWNGLQQQAKGEEKDEIRRNFLALRCIPVFMSRDDVENYYYGFCNKVIWPLFHYFPQYATFKMKFWDAYIRLNESFCNEIIQTIHDDDILWIHDYHLMLLPDMIRKKRPDIKIGFFLHIPFPAYEVFRLLPWKKEILKGLMGADLIGFHTFSYVEHFLNAVRRTMGFEHTLGLITTKNRVVKVDAFPIGIDYEKYHTAASQDSVQREIKKIRRRVGDRKIILSIDRLDYTKGIIERLEAFDYFLEKNPKYKGNVTLILMAIPSRTGVDHYARLKKQLDETVGQINGKYGTLGWVPIWYLYRSVPFPMLAALYSIANIGFVTPLRDGMNLIAKEFVATRQDGTGVLILSEMAGAVEEMAEAMVVNPNSKEETATALKDALELPREAQVERNRTMQLRLQRYNVNSWAHDFLDKLDTTIMFQQEMNGRRLTQSLKEEIIHDFAGSKRRLLLLDYDGTLVGFAGRPEKAIPDNGLLELLVKLGNNNRNDIVIISGRDKKTLDDWFRGISIGMIAEHGVWVREKASDWKLLESLRNNWKTEIRPVLEQYAVRTPGSFIEEKEYSLAWHYRKANPHLAALRASELKNALYQFIINLNLGVLDGNKVIEIKNSGINKGRAALKWIEKEKSVNFIMALGDDVTDEDLFYVLPASAYSIKVGMPPTHAKINVGSYREVRLLLKDLANH